MSGDVVLGSVTFQDMETPEEILIGGAQAYKLHKLVGGVRVADAMGRDDAQKTWSGRFLGPDALSRALQVNVMKDAGQPVSLTWDELAFTVLIVEFRANFQQPFNLTYSIGLEVISDQSQPVEGGYDETVDDQVDGDMSTANGLSASVGDTILTGQMATLQSAVSAVPSFLSATQSVVNTVLTPLAAAQGQVTSLIGQNEGVLNAIPGFAGVVAGAQSSLSASGLLSAVASMGNCSTLYNLQSVLGRIGKNLGSVQSAGTHVITNGIATLYDYASESYGDPSEWSTIARANGLVDPDVAGGLTLLIPARPDGLGGVLQA